MSESSVPWPDETYEKVNALGFPKKSYVTVQIQIRGPGGGVNYDAEMIRRTLELAGYSVKMFNNHPIEDQCREWGCATVDEWLKRSGEHFKRLGLEPPIIEMNVDNCPWGG